MSLSSGKTKEIPSSVVLVVVNLRLGLPYRDVLNRKVNALYVCIRNVSHETLLSHLMNCTDYFINIHLISFISSCFELMKWL